MSDSTAIAEPQPSPQATADKIGIIVRPEGDQVLIYFPGMNAVLLDQQAARRFAEAVRVASHKARKHKR